MFVFVMFKIDFPNGFRFVDHGSSHRAELARPTSEEQLQIDHIGNDFGHLGNSFVDVLFGDGLNLFGFGSRGLSFFDRSNFPNGSDHF